MSTPAYGTVRALLRAAVGVFFQEVAVTGAEQIPADGAVIFAGNHPNSLIDPVMVLTHCGRTLRFAAKDKLFDPPLGPVLRAVGAVPIARRMDHGEGERDNAASMAALADVLATGGAIGIFPEGLSHDQSQLQRLRTGAARLALEAAGRGAAVQIVPVGLTYVRRKHFRSRALIQFGPPIPVDAAEVLAWRADPFAAARALTDRMEAALLGLTVNAPDWETLRVLDGVRRLYQPVQVSLADRAELCRRFCTWYPRLAHHPEVAALYKDVADFLDALDDSGLDDRDLVRGLVGRSLTRRAAHNLAGGLLWLPLALPGLPLHLPLLVLIGVAGLWFAPRKDVIGTTRLMLGLLGVLAGYALAPLLLAWWAGPIAGLLLAFALPLSGLATLRLLGESGSFRRVLRTTWAGLTLGRRVQDLRERRAALQARIIDTVQRLKPDELELMFPR